MVQSMVTFGCCAWVQMDLLPELDGGGPLDMPDYISPAAAPAQSPLQLDGQGASKILITNRDFPVHLARPCRVLHDICSAHVALACPKAVRAVAHGSQLQAGIALLPNPEVASRLHKQCRRHHTHS